MTLFIFFTLDKRSMTIQVDMDLEQVEVPPADDDEISKTPEHLPPPLSCSTVELSMTGRRKKKLFTEKLGPQELD